MFGRHFCQRPWPKPLSNTVPRKLMATFFLLFNFLSFYLFRYFLAFYSFRSKRLPEISSFYFQSIKNKFCHFPHAWHSYCNMVFRHRQMPEELQLTDARGRGFESRLCRQRWQSSSEDRARNNFSTSSCRSAPLRADAGRITFWNSRFNSCKRLTSVLHPANLAAHLFSRHGKTNALETTLVAGSSPAPLSAGSSVW